jgi:hypothetical protein
MTWPILILNTLLIMFIAFLFGLVLMILMRGLFTDQLWGRASNALSHNPGRLTRHKAQFFSERQARRVFGDAEVERYKKYGDDDPPDTTQRIHPYRG